MVMIDLFGMATCEEGGIWERFLIQEWYSEFRSLQLNIDMNFYVHRFHHV